MAKESFKHHLISLLYFVGLLVCMLMAAFTIAMLIRKETTSAILGIVITVLVAVLIRKIPKHIRESKHKIIWTVYSAALLLLSGIFAFTGNDNTSIKTSESSSVNSSENKIAETEVVPDRNLVEIDSEEEIDSSESETTVTTSQPTTTTEATTKQTTTTTKQTTTTKATTTTKQTTTTAETTTTTIPTTTTIQTTTTQIKIIHFIVNYESNCVHCSSSCSAAQQILAEHYGEIDIPENELGNYTGVYWACGKCSRRYSNELPKFE